MKNPLLVRFCVCFACLVSSGGAQVPGSEVKPNVAALAAAIDRNLVQARYENGKALARAGDEAGALNEFLWLFDIGMPAVPSFRGVRLSFLLNDIKRLGEHSRLAREALRERCDAAEWRLLARTDDREAGADFAALAAVLEDEPRMLKVFETIPQGDPRRATLGHRVYKLLLARKRYADALEVMPYARMKTQFEHARSRPFLDDRRGGDLHRRMALTNALEAIEVLAGAKQIDQARELIGLLLEYDATRATVRALDKALKRAGQPDLLKAAPTASAPAKP